MSAGGPDLVTGGTGFVGAHVVRALLSRGRSVRCLVRPASRLSNLEGLPVEIVRGDIGDRPGLDAAVRGAEVVYHCAADYRLYARHPGEIYAANVEGTENVLSASAAAGVRTIVYTSSVATLAPRRDGTPADETHIAAEGDVIGHYKRSKVLAERVALRHAARGLPVVVVNPSTPVGELDVKPTPTGRIVADFLRRRMPAYVDTGLNVVDVRDVALGHLLAAEKGRPGERYILGHRNLTLKELLDILGAISGLRRRRSGCHWIPSRRPRSTTALAAPRARTAELSKAPGWRDTECSSTDSRKAVAGSGFREPIEAALARAWPGSGKTATRKTRRGRETRHDRNRRRASREIGPSSLVQGASRRTPCLARPRRHHRLCVATTGEGSARPGIGRRLLRKFPFRALVGMGIARRSPGLREGEIFAAREVRGAADAVFLRRVWLARGETLRPRRRDHVGRRSALVRRRGPSSSARLGEPARWQPTRSRPPGRAPPPKRGYRSSRCAPSLDPAAGTCRLSQGRAARRRDRSRCDRHALLHPRPFPSSWAKAAHAPAMARLADAVARLVSETA